MIEGAVLEGQGERIRLSKLDPLSEVTPRGQDSRCFDEVRSEVDRRHSATAFGREVARGGRRGCNRDRARTCRPVCARVPHAPASPRSRGCAAGRTAIGPGGWASRDQLRRLEAHSRSAIVPTDPRSLLRPTPHCRPRRHCRNVGGRCPTLDPSRLDEARRMDDR